MARIGHQPKAELIMNKIANIVEPTSNESSVVTTAIGGRCMLSDKSEFPCETIQFSRNTLSLATLARAKIGEPIIVYLDYIGRLEGVILRNTDSGFVLSLAPLSSNKQEKLEYQLSWLVNRASHKKRDRRHERIVPHFRHCLIQWGDDYEQVVRLIDISISGAGITTSLKLPIGMGVLLGKTPGHVTRQFENGMAIEFNSPIPIDLFDEELKL